MRRILAVGWVAWAAIAAAACTSEDAPVDGTGGVATGGAAGSSGGTAGVGGAGGTAGTSASPGSCANACGDPTVRGSDQCDCEASCQVMGSCCKDFAEHCVRISTCRKYCCTAADCQAGQVCQPLAPTLGTLGVCLDDAAAADGGPLGDAAPPPDAGADDASASDAAEADDAAIESGSDAGIALPPGCVTDPTFVVGCNPVTNEGCTSTEACDQGTSNGTLGVSCWPDGNVTPRGSQCFPQQNKYCVPTNACHTAECANGTKDGKETDVDCGGSALSSCLACGPGKTCKVSADCRSKNCDQGVCT